MSETPDSLPPSSASASPDVDLSGRQLGDYRLLRRLGQGAMAVVYLAQQDSLRRQVALKILRSELADDESFVKRFHNEAQAAASLSHVNLVQIHEVGCIDQHHYIAQEYVQGQNLAELIARNGPPELPLAVAVMRQAASALYKAGEKGIVHRDIKPENILITADGLVKVADFGLARINHDTTAVNLTQVGVTMGTPLYMSPEQVEGRPLDPRSDIYSLGVTCYHMLAGRTPYTGETALAVAVQHVRGQAERLENLRPDLPGALCRIVHKMLEKDPAQRHQQARELIGDLRALQMEGLSDDWAESLDGWVDHESALMLDARTAATQQLAAVMQESPAGVGTRRRRILIAICVASSLMAGGVAAWSVREDPLLAGAAAPDEPRQATAQQQLAYASIARTEAAFRSVERYFPQATDVVHRSRHELALYFLLEDEYDDAGEVFDQFAALDPIEQESLRAFGITGQCVVHSLRGEEDEFAASLEQLKAMIKRDGGRFEPRELSTKLQLDGRIIRLLSLEMTRNRLDRQSAWVEYEKRRRSSLDGT